MEHKPVLLEESIRALEIKPDGVYVDCTLGRGGHSEEIAKRLTSGRLIGIDRDETAIREAGERLKPYGKRVTLVHDSFSALRKALDMLGIERTDGFLFDLGVSSPQLDDPKRGFSYMHDAPLDMRMDMSSAVNAYDIVNGFDEKELRRILWDYGEERYAPAIAAAIVKHRTSCPVKTTGELVEIIRSAMPGKALREKQHPAKRSFQAIRIAVNDELGEIASALGDAADSLNPKGRLCVISFHSLEDRIVKSAFASREKGCTCPKDFPVCVCGFVQTLRVVTRKPIVPTDKEMQENPRARSAKLRVAERV